MAQAASLHVGTADGRRITTIAKNGLSVLSLEICRTGWVSKWAIDERLGGELADGVAGRRWESGIVGWRHKRPGALSSVDLEAPASSVWLTLAWEWGRLVRLSTYRYASKGLPRVSRPPPAVGGAGYARGWQMQLGLRNPDSIRSDCSRRRRCRTMVGDIVD